MKHGFAIFRGEKSLTWQIWELCNKKEQCCKYFFIFELSNFSENQKGIFKQQKQFKK